MVCPVGFDDTRGERLVLPSPNGSTISFSLHVPHVLCGCLRNAAAVAGVAQELGARILVIAAGETWPDGRLRPCLEDQIGAGAILSELKGAMSVEARSAVAVFREFQRDLKSAIDRCSSGKELTERGFPEDNELAACFNVSKAVPILKEKAFIDYAVGL